MARHSNKLLTVENASLSGGANVEQRSDNGGYHQHWELLDAGDGYYNIRNRNSNQMLDVNGAGTGDGANVIQWPPTALTIKSGDSFR